jgi:phage protein D
MCTKWTRASLLIAMLAGAPGAWADGNEKGGADPATKTLPAAVSDTAKVNAFGQQGARSKAAHQAARAAAVHEAHAAVDQAQPAGSMARPSASAQTHASTTGVTNGFDRAAAGSANGQGSTHRH